MEVQVDDPDPAAGSHTVLIISVDFREAAQNEGLNTTGIISPRRSFLFRPSELDNLMTFMELVFPAEYLP